MKTFIRSLGRPFRRVYGHLTMLLVRARQDLADPNQTWLVIVVCLLSLAMSLRMADAAGWIHSYPLARVPVPGSSGLVRQSDLFWDNITDTRASCLALLLGTLLALIARLERQRILMMVGLYLLMVWWWVTGLTMWFQLGVSVGGLYLMAATASSVATIKTLQTFNDHDLREAEVDNAVLLVAKVLDLQEEIHSSELHSSETKLTLKNLG